jgi:hypothetical protein
MIHTERAILPSALALGLGLSVAVPLAYQERPVSSPVVRDLNHKAHRPLTVAEGIKANCLIFVLHDCPISNQYSLEIQRIQRVFEGKGIRFYLVYSDPDADVEVVRKHVRDFGHKATALLDREHRLARKTGATMSPEAAVVLPGGAIAYRGRIDDRYPELGVRRERPTSFDLREALSAVAGGRKPARARTKAVGCYLPPRSDT